MALRLVNTAPGQSTDPVKPTEPVYLGMKNTTGTSDRASLQVSMGYTGVIHRGLLPDQDPVLQNLGANIKYVTPERREPVLGSVSSIISSGSVLFTKSTNSDNERCIYELKMPVGIAASALGYIKFRTNTSWTQFSPDWCNLTNMTGVYLGLEHGSFNTALYAFLRNDGANGSLVTGGPLPAFSSARPGQVQTASFDWMSLPNNSVVELWIFFNVTGYAPSYVPVVEVWKKMGADTVPTLLLTTPVGSLGTYQEDGFTNYRDTREEQVTLHFGLAGRSGDTLRVDDYALFPDYRLAVVGGLAIPGCEVSVQPDGMMSYRAREGIHPYKQVPSRWFPSSEFIRPSADFFYQPGSQTIPYALQVRRKGLFGAAFERVEPRIEQPTAGGMIEAFMYGEQETRVSDTFGPGLAIDDGTKIYRAVLLETVSTKTIGIMKSDADETVTGYYIPASEIDWSSPKLIRLSLDKVRQKVSLSVDEETVLEVPTSSTLPASPSGVGRVQFGILKNNASAGFARFCEVNYAPRFNAFESRDQLLPSAAPLSWTLDLSGTGSVALEPAAPNATAVKLSKPDSSVIGSRTFYKRNDDFEERKGFFVDFEMKCPFYTDAFGQGLAKNVYSGVSLKVHLSAKVLNLAFVDAGILGKKFGIVPGSGSVDDLVNQTALGANFSASIDWTLKTRYRILFRAYDSIKVWAGTVVKDPILVIPWRNDTDGFDLPVDVSTPRIEFGHFEHLTASESMWSYVRYGISNGAEVAVSLKYQDGAPSYLFGGKAFARAEFS